MKIIAWLRGAVSACVKWFFGLSTYVQILLAAGALTLVIGSGVLVKNVYKPDTLPPEQTSQNDTQPAPQTPDTTAPGKKNNSKNPNNSDGTPAGGGGSDNGRTPSGSSGGNRGSDPGSGKDNESEDNKEPTPTPTPTPNPKPTANNTGVQSGVSLTTHNGNYIITTNGTNLSNMHITGSLFVVANNVTVTNVRVGNRIVINQDDNGNSPHPVKSNITFRRVEAKTIDNVGLENVTIDKAKLFGGPTSTHFQATNLRIGETLWQCNDLTLINSYFAKPPPVPTSEPDTHRDAFHPMGCTNMVIKNNVFDMRSSDNFTLEHTTATSFFQTFNGVIIENVTYEGNYHYGGGYYQVYLLAKNMTVKNNRFYSYDGMATIVFPPSAYDETYYPFVQSGNQIDDKPAALPNST